MKTIIQKVYINDSESFACRTYTTPHFETNWHKHIEAEIIFILQGFGTVMIGDFVGEYKEGDAFYISSEMPHWFRKNNNVAIGSALVAQFNPMLFGQTFLNIPEMLVVKSWLSKNIGCQFNKNNANHIHQHLTNILNANYAFHRIHTLMQLLQNIGSTYPHQILSQDFNAQHNSTNPAIEVIIEYTLKNYLLPLSLAEVAPIAKMSIPTFCRFFKRNVKKTYFDFVQELRINHACKMLIEQEKPIIEVCYESGFNSWSHFSKQFKRIKKTTPSKFKKEFMV